jgi:anti-anti-sigma regulatory factor
MTALAATLLASERQVSGGMLISLVAAGALVTALALGMLGTATVRHEQGALRDRQGPWSEVADHQRWHDTLSSIDEQLGWIAQLSDEAALRRAVPAQRSQPATDAPPAAARPAAQRAAPPKPVPSLRGQGLSMTVRHLTGSHVELALIGDLDSSEQEIFTLVLTAALTDDAKIITIDLAEARVHGRAGVAVLVHARSVAGSLGARLQVTHADGLIAAALTAHGVALSTPR